MLLHASGRAVGDAVLDTVTIDEPVVVADGIASHTARGQPWFRHAKILSSVYA
jgi:hypothetical protein